MGNVQLSFLGEILIGRLNHVSRMSIVGLLPTVVRVHPDRLLRTFLYTLDTITYSISLEIDAFIQ